MVDAPAYRHFAAVYDELMREAPYERWADYLNRMTDTFGVAGRRVLDLGCGTGTLALLLAEKGWDVTGVDQSEDMLAVADEKISRADANIALIQQDLRALDLGAAYDVAVAFCDVLNYMASIEEAEDVIRRVHRHLSPGGLFLFDVHSVYKIDRVFRDASFCSGEDDIAYIWECFPGDEPHSVYHELSFFVREPSGLYRRFDETHYERTYPAETYLDALKRAGFTEVRVEADFQCEPPKDTSERLFFAAQK